MYFNLALAVALAVIAAYTDIKETKVYNKHVFPFMALGLILALVQKQYQLILSAGIIFGFYCIFYYGTNFISKIAFMMGSLPVPSGEKAMGGGDVKLSTALALFVGHIPVLYGTALAAVLMMVYHGIRMWQINGTPKAAVDVALGRVHITTAFAPFLGIAIVAVTLLLIHL